MVADGWEIFAKRFGKLARLYDNAAAAATVMTQASLSLLDQFADADVIASWNLSVIVAARVAQYNQAVVAGPATTKVQAVAAARSVLLKMVSENEYGVTWTAASQADPAAALQVLASLAATDAKTFKTKSSLGVLNFLDQVNSSLSPAFPSAGSPTYDDAVYCVDEVVAP